MESKSPKNGIAKGKRRKELKALTPIDEPVVILLECLGAISLPLEMHRGHTFRPAGAVVVKGDLAKRADCRVEQFLKIRSVLSEVRQT
jgi:hypothetical protein